MLQPDLNPLLVLDQTPALIFSAGPDGSVDYFNRRWLEEVGAPLESILGWGWTQYIHPEDREEHVRVWRASVSSGEPAAFESRIRRADGEYRWMLHRMLPLR